MAGRLRVSGGPGTAERLDASLLKLGGIVSLGALAPLLDTTIVNVAVDSLRRDLHTSVATIQWVSTGYLLTLAMVVPLVGWLVELLGAKLAWMGSLAVFLAGSLLCSAAWSPLSLIAFRLFQGIGAGLIFPVMQVILARAAGPGRLGRVMAIVAIPGQLGPIVGPVAGGLIVNDLGWRWIFYVNVPLCVAALLLSRRGIPDDGRGSPGRLDVTGLVTLPAGFALLIYALTQLGSGGGAGVLVTAALACVLLAAFCVHALRAPLALVDVRLFRVRSFTISAVAIFWAQAAIFGSLFLLPLYFQVAQRRSAAETGFLLAFQGLGAMAVLPAAGALTDRLGPRAVVLAGIVISLAGTLPFALAPGDHDYLLSGIILFVRGAGLAATSIPITAAYYRGLSRDDIPRATALFNVVQRVGSSLGTVVLAVVVQDQLRHLGPASAFGVTFEWVVVFTAVTLAPACWLGARLRGAAAPEPTS
jgi:EmrB/QacA subfamily drug resistance transporter